LGQVSPLDVIAIADELAQRQSRLFSGLNDDPGTWTIPSTEIFSAVTYTRANARSLAAYFAAPSCADRLFAELLAGEAPTPVRVAAFVEKLDTLDIRLALELATGLLHNTAPQDHWLWTRWLWDPTTGSGTLPLLAGSTHNLMADNLADGYLRVGAVTAMSLKFGEGTGLFSPELLRDEKRASFANSAFLACVYSVYMYATTSWRLSREFNRLLPSLPGMARRLLGLRKPEAHRNIDETKETM
jgi:hypothetical protein